MRTSSAHRRARRGRHGETAARYLLPAALVLLGLFLLTRGVRLENDSAGYLDGEVFRTAAYPLLLDLLQLLFGGAATQAAVVLQIVLGLCSATALAVYLHRVLGAGRWARWLLLAVLLLPYYGPLSVGNSILSEGLAYPLFLIAMRFLLAALVERRLRPFLIATGVTAAAVLTRQQLLFLYPVLGLVSIYLLARRSLRVFLLAFASLALTLAASDLAERAYHQVRHGVFTRAPFSGIQLMAVALYVAEESDAARLPGADGELFGSLFRQATERGLLTDANPSPRGIASYAWHYRQTYNEIVWRLLVPELRARGGRRELTVQDWVSAERRLVPMSRVLLSAHPAAFARLYVSNVLSGLGFYYALLLVVVTPLALYRGLRPGQTAALVLAAVTITHLMNYALIGLIQAVRLRYTFYSDGLVLALVVLGVVSGWRRDPPAPDDPGRRIS